MRHVADQHDTLPPKPLTEPVFFVLTSLAEQPRHGYALLQDIERMSQGRVKLSTGTLYGALRRLLEDGFIERFEQHDTSRDKQAYRLTPFGRRQLEEELQRLRQLTKAAASRLARAKHAYRIALRLYPADYQAAFAAEMLATFEQSLSDRRKNAFAEWVSLLVGVATEWFAKWTTDAAMRGRALPDLRMMRPVGVTKAEWFAHAHLVD